MSYILEALKESQRSRDNQPVPDISTIQVSPELDSEPERTNRRRLIAILVLIVALGAGGGWWFAGQPGEKIQPHAEQQHISVEEVQISSVQVSGIQGSAIDEVVVPSVAVTEIAPESEPLIMIDEAPPAIVDQEPAVVNEVVAEKQIVKPPVVKPPVVKPVVKSVPAEVVAVEETPVQPILLEEVTEVVAIPAAEPEAEVVVLPEIQSEIQSEKQVAVEEVRPEQMAAATETQAEMVAAVSDVVDESPTELAVTLPEAEQPVGEERVPHYRELPFDIQQEVQGVHFSVHIFSPNPARRFVKIKGVVHREGSEVTPGLILDEVTQNGAIFTYRDYRFWMPVQ
tara:strand:- start:13896 stop:14918 length:1023 start_codon:yes stop_codon:yes gene_type:complete